MLRKFLSFGDHGARTDDAAAADLRAVHDDRAHADKSPVLKRAAVQDDVVADRAILSDYQRKAGIGMAGRIVLNVGILADLDPFVVAAQHRPEPHARGVMETDLADHRCRVGNEVVSAGGKFGRLPVECVDRHKDLLSAETLARRMTRFQARRSPFSFRPGRRRRAASSGRRCRTSGSRTRPTRLPSSRIRTACARSARRARCCA